MACSCSQPCSARSCWEPAGSPLAEQVEGVAVGDVDLAAVDREPGGRDQPGGGEAVQVVGDPAHPDRLGLAGVAQHPQAAPRAGIHRGQDGFDLAGGSLGDLVEHHHGARGQRPVAQIDAQPGDGASIQAGPGQLGHRLGRGGHRDHRPTLAGRGLGGGAQHGRLAVPSRGQHGPQAAARPHSP